jgi:polar amino acid transport system substrate-binding protein
MRKNLKRSWLAALPLLLAGTIAACDTTADSTFSDGALEAVRERGELVVGSDIPYGVMEFYDEQGEPVGIDMDLGREIADRIGVPMRVEAMPFDDLFDAVKEGRVDAVISAVTITPERQETMDFSAPYLDAGTYVAIRAGNTDIRSVEDLSDMRVGVIGGTIGEEMARESEHVNDEGIVLFENNDERLEALKSGEIDAALVHFQTNSDPDLELVGDPLRQSYYGVVTRKGNESLMAEIDATLRELKRTGRLEEIRESYEDNAGN